MAVKDILLAEFDHEMGTTRRLLERIPDEKLTWKPHDRSMTMGRLATHLSNIPHWSGTILNDTSFDLANAAPNGEAKETRSDILRQFDEGSASARGMLAGVSDAELNASWLLKRAGQQMFSMPRIAAFRSFVVNHMIHHRGQLSVYLRLNDIPVPSIYGPSADES
jgi:uncharacterized damage-inducible protein DinB